MRQGQAYVAVGTRARGALGGLLLLVALSACQSSPGGAPPAAVQPPAADAPLAAADLPGYGEVRLVAVADLSARPRVDYLLQDSQGRTLVRLPDFPPNQDYAYDDTRAAAFADIDGDGREDIAIIAGFMTGIGPGGAEPFAVAGFYLRAGDGFAADAELGELVNAPGQRARWRSIEELIEVARAAMP